MRGFLLQGGTLSEAIAFLRGPESPCEGGCSQDVINEALNSDIVSRTEAKVKKVSVAIANLPGGSSAARSSTAALVGSALLVGAVLLVMRD